MTWREALRNPVWWGIVIGAILTGFIAGIIFLYVRG